MYVVTVQFEIYHQYIPQFKIAMENQARNSIDREKDCHVFDVAYDQDNTGHCFLYEVYTDKPAFEFHMASSHFESFNRLVNDWLKSKTVKTYEREWPRSE